VAVVRSQTKDPVKQSVHPTHIIPQYPEVPPNTEAKQFMACF
jgi:hypothetical protein